MGTQSIIYTLLKTDIHQAGEDANKIVFFPLYPLLIRLLTFITNNYFISGLLISNVCLGIASCFLYKLTRKELGRRNALDSLFAFLLYPFGVFLIVVFTESLFIMLSLMCLTFIKDKRWLLAGVCGLLASLAKSQGIALIVPAVYELIICSKNKQKFDIKGLFVFLIPLGTGIYLLINKLLQGNWFAFIEHQKAPPWYNSADWISNNLVTHFNMALEYDYLGIIIYWVELFIYFVAIIALFYGLKRKVSTSIIAYGGAYLFISYLQNWLISGPRYMLSCTPLYIVFASINNKFIKNILLVSLALLTVAYTVCSMQGQAIM